MQEKHTLDKTSYFSLSFDNVQKSCISLAIPVATETAMNFCKKVQLMTIKNTEKVQLIHKKTPKKVQLISKTS